MVLLPSQTRSGLIPVVTLLGHSSYQPIRRMESPSRVPTFRVHVLELKALGVDALSQPWQGWSMYMFLPLPFAEQGVPETLSHSEWQGHSDSPKMVVSAMVSTSG